MADKLLPVKLTKEGSDRLLIDWNDGHHSVYQWQHLRSNCPCAGCREEKQKPVDPFHILSTKELEIKGPLRPVEFVPVGYYAYRVKWSDGHDTGIFTLENLRELCQCEQCNQKK